MIVRHICSAVFLPTLTIRQAKFSRPRPRQPHNGKRKYSNTTNTAPDSIYENRQLKLENKVPAMLDQAAKHFNIKTLEDWYKITGIDILKLSKQQPSWWSTSLRQLLRRHQNSLSALLSSAYPSHPWIVWKFSSIPHVRQ